MVLDSRLFTIEIFYLGILRAIAAAKQYPISTANICRYYFRSNSELAAQNMVMAHAIMIDGPERPGINTVD